MIKRMGVGKRLSNIVIHNDTIYLAGLVADDTTADVAGQTRQVLAKIETALKAAGSDKTKMLMATIWLADIKDFDAMNRVWDPWIPEGQPPTRACIESRLARPELKVEIRVIASL
jgi:enamine deaminase RidA (YjgF/YER057c/UK114 family)